MNVVEATEQNVRATTDLPELAAGFAALAHPARLRILCHLACRDACCCREIVEAFDLAQSTVSQHLKVLVEAGLVRYVPENRRSRYMVDREALARLQDRASTFLSSCCA